MSERIKPRVIEGKGIASEILYEFHGRFAKATEGVVYYHLKDKTQTTQIRRINGNEVLTLPYRIVFSEKIKVTGNDLATLKQNSAYAKNVAFARSGVEEDIVDTVTYTYKYFAVRNRMSQRGRNGGRQTIDRGAYRLYEKPSAAKTGLNSYTFLSEYVGEPERFPVKDKKGNIIGYEDRPFSNNYGAGIIDIQVTTSNTGQRTYTVASNSRGDEFYTNLIQPYL
jgi:hypothetical protein